jgi:AAA domain, putative AbiEii toxin, Type IV TA system
VVRTELSSFQPLELRPEVLRQYSPLGRFELGEHGENFAAVVYGLIEQVGKEGSDGQETGQLSANDRLRAIVSWLSELTPRAVTSISASLSPTSEVIFALTEEPFAKEITARSLSDGTLRFAALALALLGFSGRRTLVIEELENGINPTRLQLLLRMIEQTVSEHKDAQVIASTHSPTVLEFASPSTLEGSLVLGWDEENLASRVERMGSLLKRAGEARLSDLQAEGWLQFAADR